MLVAGVGALLLLAAAQPAWAGTEVSIQVTVVHASHAGKRVDPALKDLQRQLEDFGFTSYVLEDQRKLTLKLKAPGEVPLPGGRVLTVTPVAREPDGRLKIRVAIGPKKILDTTVIVEPGGTFIIGGPKYEGGVLMIAVSHLAAR
ncbi:MAG: hypothetical protein D6729_17855 [Deltaproteobacteria bacterium]|nr:MAG: hypothetical protein D6729_17855 [Deltaproteobacteria bacterium]